MHHARSWFGHVVDHREGLVILYVRETLCWDRAFVRGTWDAFEIGQNKAGDLGFLVVHWHSLKKWEKTTTYRQHIQRLCKRERERERYSTGRLFPSSSFVFNSSASFFFPYKLS